MKGLAAGVLPALVVGLVACAGAPAPATAVVPSTAPAPVAPAGIPFPNPTLTPGAVFAGVTTAQVCTPGYSSRGRSVSSSVKALVYSEYHIADTPGAHEVDHLISLELGGSNDLRNLWPEPYAGAYGAHAKDKVENYLHGEVCAERMTLAAAQAAIAGPWWTYLGAAVR
jgi:hypothetical protein